MRFLDFTPFRSGSGDPCRGAAFFSSSMRICAPKGERGREESPDELGRAGHRSSLRLGSLWRPPSPPTQCWPSCWRALRATPVNIEEGGTGGLAPEWLNIEARATSGFKAESLPLGGQSVRKTGVLRVQVRLAVAVRLLGRRSSYWRRRMPPRGRGLPIRIEME